MSEFNIKESVEIGATILNALNKSGITSPAEVLNDLFNGIFGYPIKSFSEKRRLKCEADIKEFQIELAQKIIKKTQQNSNLKEPDVSIIGPALEASKYYYDKQEIRSMFANLIASSLDPEQDNYLHHSFVEILKQLSPNDANLLKIINGVGLPVGDINLVDKENSGLYSLIKKFYISTEFPNFSKNAISINNLERLGLIEINDHYSFINEDFYKPFLESDEFKTLSEKYKDNSFYKVELYKMIMKITPLGRALQEICLEK